MMRGYVTKLLLAALNRNRKTIVKIIAVAITKPKSNAAPVRVGRVTPVRAVFWRAEDCPPYLRCVAV